MTQLERNKHLLIWQRSEWPYFTWDSSALLDSLVKLRHQQGRLLALASSFAPDQAVVLTDIQMDILEHYQMELTQERLCGWQASIFPNGFSGIHRISTGEFRPHDFTLNLRHTPPFAKSLEKEVQTFLAWWNDSPVGLDGIIRAGLAYFWFMTLLPFEDGNARVGKNLVYLALAQDEKMGLRPYSLEDIFVQKKTSVEEIVLACQEKNGDITLWLKWFFEQLLFAINSTLESKAQLSSELLFLKKAEHLKLNPRQRKIISFLFSTKQKITNRQCVDLCETSRESIKRDLTQMVKWNLLSRGEAQGRSISYSLRNS